MLLRLSWREILASFSLGHKREKSLNFDIAICTQKNKEPALKILEYFDIKDFFTGFAFGDSLDVLKPDPLMVDFALKNFEKAKSLKNDFFQADISIAKIHLSNSDSAIALENLNAFEVTNLRAHHLLSFRQKYVVTNMKPVSLYPAATYRLLLFDLQFL